MNANKLYWILITINGVLIIWNGIVLSRNIKRLKLLNEMYDELKKLGEDKNDSE